jgi:hypothetical protein
MKALHFSAIMGNVYPLASMGFLTPLQNTVVCIQGSTNLATHLHKLNMDLVIYVSWKLELGIKFISPNIIILHIRNGAATGRG